MWSCFSFNTVLTRVGLPSDGPDCLPRMLLWDPLSLSESVRWEKKGFDENNSRKREATAKIWNVVKLNKPFSLNRKQRNVFNQYLFRFSILLNKYLSLSRQSSKHRPKTKKTKKVKSKSCFVWLQTEKSSLSQTKKKRKKSKEFFFWDVFIGNNSSWKIHETKRFGNLKNCKVK